MVLQSFDIPIRSWCFKAHKGRSNGDLYGSRTYPDIDQDDPRVRRVASRLLAWEEDTYKEDNLERILAKHGHSNGYEICN
jgi:hypothetical protein